MLGPTLLLCLRSEAEVGSSRLLGIPMSFDRQAYMREYKRTRKAAGTWNRGSKGDTKGQWRRWAATHTRTRTTEYKQTCRRRRIERVYPEYAKKLLCAGTVLRSCDLPRVLVEAKQAEIRLRRALRHGNDCKTEDAGRSA